MKPLHLVAAAGCLLLAAQPADAAGCLKGAALGAIAGHLTHHTFLGLFGGCAGGILVHHMYVKWKKTHPQGTMQDFVNDNGDKLPPGWEERLSAVGDKNIRAQ